jgi:hypothetical protein
MLLIIRLKECAVPDDAVESMKRSAGRMSTRVVRKKISTPIGPEHKDKWTMRGYHRETTTKDSGREWFVRLGSRRYWRRSTTDLLATALAMEHPLSHRYRRPFQHDLPSVWWHDFLQHLQLDLRYSESDTTL